jgi:hypothetical protein
MPDSIDTSLDNTIQQSIKTGGGSGVGILSLLLSMGAADGLISKWWSPTRDQQLDDFWKSSDHLSGAVYSMVSKMTTIPVKAIPRDTSIKSHVQIAEQYTDNLINASQFGEGWMTFFSKCVTDLLTRDNGVFVEVIGPGDKLGPITGPAFSMAHLDSARCFRTGNPEYPVVFTDVDGRSYKLHNSRVIYMAQMTSPRREMNGVGYSAISRCINAAQNLIDISVYKQEKMGSRPQRQIFITRGGLDPEDLKEAIRVSDSTLSSQGLTRFAKSIAVGDRTIPDADMKQIDIASVPDGFDEKESTILGMSVIALAFGTDARDLFPGMESGATKADAIIQHIKQRGKGAGQILQSFENAISQKFLPQFLKCVFDNQDDSEDRQAAEISNIRAQARERDVANKITNIRVERELMLKRGEISEAQFEELELNDGRLEDGVEVEVLFESNDKDYVEFLGDVDENNYEERKTKIMGYVVNSKDVNRIKKARRAIAAINHRYDTEDILGAEIDKNKLSAINQADVSNVDNPVKVAKPDTSYQDEKFGRKLPRQLVNAVDEVSVAQSEGV